MPHMKRRIKCAHTCCPATTRNPAANGWEYRDDLHGINLHNGWWCPASIEGLNKILGEIVADAHARGTAVLVGIEPDTRH